MAKSKGFFTLRRGSTKSLTFQVVDGQQITKDRVSVVRNPRTMRQQYQRAVMATCMAAYSHMKAIENHAFQGKSKGKGNQREFMRLNLPKVRAAIASDIENARTAANCKGFVNFPKSNDLVSNEYVISKGALDSQLLLGYGVGDALIDDGKLSFSPYFPLHQVSGNFKLGVFLAANNLVPGSQITLVWSNLEFNDKKSVPGSGNAAGWSYIPGMFKYARFVLKKDIDLNQEIVVTEQTTPQTLAGIILDEIWDEERCTFSPVPSVEDGKLVVNLEEVLGYFDATLTGMFGIITSIVDTDERDTSVMKLVHPDTSITAGDTGLTYHAIPSAWQEDITLGNSELYLEGGE